jgi:type III secretion protein D
MTARFRWKLLFQSGLLDKQALHLPDGVVTMGSGNEWDIDMLGAMQGAHKGESGHIELNVSEEGVFLHLLGLRCTIDGKGVTAEEIPLQAGQTVDLAGCQFVLERVAEETAFSGSERFDADEWDTANAADEDIEAVAGGQHPTMDTATLDGADAWRQENTVEQTQRSGKYAKAVSAPKRWLRVLGVALPGGVAAAIVLALAYASQELRASVVQPSEPFSLERYQESLSQAGLSTVKIERDKNGTVKLSGGCWDSNKFQPFLSRLMASGTAYQNQVLCQDDLQRSVAYVLQTHGYSHVRVVSGSHLGSVVIAGNIRADARWKEVTKQLNNLHGLKEWSVHNDAQESLSGLIVALRERGLLSKLSLSRQDDVLTVTGQLDDAEQTILQEVLQPYTTASSATLEQSESTTAAKESIKHRTPLRVIYQNIPALRQEPGIFPSPIVSLSGNKRTAALLLANGMIVQAGSALPSGYTITQLDEAGIELQKEGQFVHFPLEF